MNEEIDNEIVEEVADPIEEKARSGGWVPKEDWKGDPTLWRDAGTFVDRESFFKKIKSQSNEIRELRDSFQKLSEHHSKVAQFERARAIEELKSQKKAALDEGNHDRVIELDDQIQEVKSANTSPIVEVQNTNYNNALKEFKENNEWYESDQELTELADTLGIGYVDKRGGVKALREGKIDHDEMFKYIEKAVNKATMAKKDEVEEAKEGKRNNKEEVVLPTGRKVSNSGGGKKTFSPRDLTDEARTVAKRFVEMGVFKTQQEYVDELVKTGDLK